MLKINFIDSIHRIDANDWNQLLSVDYPFLRHEFFNCLEDSGDTSAKTGWQPHHLVVYKDDQLIAAVPLFIKSHSYGEYMFDWAWAQAYHHHGMEYYPKLLNAIPFTPSTGERWLIKNKELKEQLFPIISESIIKESVRLNCSSAHCLFPIENHSNNLERLNWLHRTGYQYHWFNNGYNNFDDFLSALSSRKRKNIIKERNKILTQEIAIEVKEGAQLSSDDWTLFYNFYKDTYLKRSGHTGYLSLDFFISIGKKMPNSVAMIQAKKTLNDSSIVIAAALFFKDTTTLYGRYWGCHHDFDSLHFELCYYQGIEYAIKHNLQKIDAGAQGEHKIQRGFKPITVFSNHWINHTGFRDAITKFIQEEKKDVTAHINAASELLPFKK